jgi:hypothetical protein
MLKTNSIIGLALVMFAASSAMAQTRGEESVGKPPDRSLDLSLLSSGSVTTNPAEWSTYWIGIEVMPVPAALRSQLNLAKKQGLLVASIPKNSPAEKAGITRHDVLLRAGDKPLANPRDLLAAVEAAKETKLKVELIRGGKPTTVEVTPAKRPEPMFLGPDAADQADWDTVQRWVESMTPGNEQGAARPHIHFNFVQPGAIIPPHAFAIGALPANLSIAISKSGDQPAKIEVERGSEKWSLTEKDLDKLPADVRRYVERMLRPSGLSGSVKIGADAFNFAPAILIAPRSSSPQAMPTPDDVRQQVERRFEEMNRRMEAMRKMIEQQQRSILAPPQQPAAEPMLEKKK